ncbi:VOC family protein [Nocardiopsis prasina]|uniref:VOC family protein n=1 Tax=Nocardiopsis prasina TaxID=2015 RepID=UPI0004765024|nr:VOC family protein [Nocardiopsis prasina]
MIGRLRAVTIDCPDPGALADFYSELLGLPVTRRDHDWAGIGDGTWPVIDFQRVDDHRAPAWPDPERPQQMHFEIVVADIDAAHERVLALGARPLAVSEENPDNMYRVYADPAGHPFCLEFTA